MKKAFWKRILAAIAIGLFALALIAMAFMVAATVVPSPAPWVAIIVAAVIVTVAAQLISHLLQTRAMPIRGGPGRQRTLIIGTGDGHIGTVGRGRGHPNILPFGRSTGDVSAVAT